jgi:hypothetical protein
MSADLTRTIAFRSTALNTVTYSTGDLVGCSVTRFEISPPELVQYTVKLAKDDGMDIGPVYQGARTITLNGVIYDITRGKAFDRIIALEGIMLPASGGYGTYALTYYLARNAAPGYIQKSITVRPNGLHWSTDIAMFGGPDAQPLAIPWTVTFYAANPDIT